MMKLVMIFPFVLCMNGLDEKIVLVTMTIYWRVFNVMLLCFSLFCFFIEFFAALLILVM
jgi:hypothetical protein